MSCTQRLYTAWMIMGGLSALQSQKWALRCQHNKTVAVTALGCNTMSLMTFSGQRLYCVTKSQ